MAGRPKSNVRAREVLGLHQRVKEARERANVSMGQMAAWLNVHPSNYQRLERGEVSVSAERVAEIARLLQVSVAYLYGEGAAGGGLEAGSEVA